MARLTDLVFDAVDPPALARFWASALDGFEVRPYDEAEIARLAARGLTPDTDPSVAVDGPGITLFFQRKAEAQVTAQAKRTDALHIDVRAADPSSEIARLESLGARALARRDDHTVMLDPEGNRFCVLADAQRD